MRITCFVLGVLCLLGAGAWLVLGIFNFSDTRESRPTTSSNFRMQVVDSDAQDFAQGTALAEVFAIAGVAWMVGAAAFAPRQTAGTGPQQWQAPQYGPQPPQQGGPFPPSNPFPQQGPPQHGQQQPPQG